MQVTLPINSRFLDGFIKECQDAGCNEEETEQLYRVYSNNQLLNTPEIQRGFVETLRGYTGDLSKAAMARYLTPEVLAACVECRIKSADDGLSQQLRAAIGFPEPTEEMEKAASQMPITAMPGMLAERFSSLPLNQKILVSMLLGGGVGAARRTMAPTEEDYAYGRGPINRMARGAVTGAGTGAGVAAGATLGSAMARPGSPMRLPSTVAGGAAGGLMGHDLMHRMVG